MLLCDDLRMVAVKKPPVTVRQTMIFIRMTLPDWHYTVQNKQTSHHQLLYIVALERE